MSQFLDKVLEFFKTIIPSVSAVAALMLNYFMRRISRLKQDKRNVETEKEYLQNEIQVHKDNADKSDVDILLDAIREGGGSNSDEGSGDSK